jgi:hypothetical protein
LQGESDWLSWPPALSHLIHGRLPKDGSGGGGSITNIFWKDLIRW